MAAKRKHPEDRSLRRSAAKKAQSRQTKVAATSTRDRRKAKAKSGAGDDVFPTQVMGWSTTANDQLAAPMSGLWREVMGNGAPTQFAQAVVECNAEVAALVGRRSRACLDYPAHLANCVTPQQMLAQHSQFIREMLLDCQSTNDRILKAWFENGAGR